MSNSKPFVYWFTGLSGAGKSTLARAMADYLTEQKIPFTHLDGDQFRAQQKKDLGFTADGRDQNIKDLLEHVQNAYNSNHVVLVTFVSPYRRHRQWARDRFPQFAEVFVNAPLSECEHRDVKGLYKKARDGEISHFTGIDDPYEVPESPELEIRTDQHGVAECLQVIVEYHHESTRFRTDIRT